MDLILNWLGSKPLNIFLLFCNMTWRLCRVSSVFVYIIAWSVVLGINSTSNYEVIPQAFVVLLFHILSSQKSSNSAITSMPSMIIPTSAP